MQSAVLIYESIPESRVDLYQNKLVSYLNSSYPTVPVFHLDSFSGAEMLNYASKFIEESDETLLVCYFEEKGEITGLASILNAQMEKKSGACFALNEHPLVMKLANQIGLKTLKSEQELQAATDDWIQFRVN